MTSAARRFHVLLRLYCQFPVGASGYRQTVHYSIRRTRMINMSPTHDLHWLFTSAAYEHDDGGGDVCCRSLVALTITFYIYYGVLISSCSRRFIRPIISNFVFPCKTRPKYSSDFSAAEDWIFSLCVPFLAYFSFFPGKHIFPFPCAHIVFAC